MIKLFLLLISLFFSGCSVFKETPKPLPTVKEVNINKYLGTWYEIARYEHFFEEGCVDVSATYSLNEDSTINVLNSCTKKGELSNAKGEAYSVDSTNTKLKVTFFWPFYGDYWIIMLGDNYEYAVIGEPSREYLWILSRTKTLDKKILDNILKNLENLNYDAKKLIWTEHTR